MNLESDSIKSICSIVYSELWNTFHEDPFTFIEAKEKISKLNFNHIYDLKKEQLLFIFNKSENETSFRLVPQNIFEHIKKYNLDLSWLDQGFYANLILKLFTVLKENFNKELLALGIYGSIARNTAKLESDLDLFLVFQEISEGMNRRLKQIIQIENKKCIQDELSFLYEKKILPTINYYFRKSSLLKLTFFTIDLAFDLKILFDVGVLKAFIDKINQKIKANNIQRKYLESDKYYLDLNIKFGDVFKFE